MESLLKRLELRKPKNSIELWLNDVKQSIVGQRYPAVLRRFDPYAVSNDLPKLTWLHDENIVLNYILQTL